MSHLDEGVLHSLLDGELDESARQAAETHLATCAECRRDYEEAKGLLAGADELIAAVELPPRTRPRTVPDSRGVRPTGPLFSWRTVAWAASVVLAVGLGWLARPYRMPSPMPASYSDSRPDSAPLPTAGPPAVPAEKPALGDKDELREERGRRAGAETGRLAETAASRAKESKLGPAGAPAATPAPEAAANQAPAPLQEAVRALTNPVTAQGDSSASVASRDALAEQDRVAPAAPAGESNLAASKALVGKAATTRELERSGFNAPAARRDQAIGGFQPTAMETAVRMLGGSIRLVDGLTPIRVMVGPGSVVSGANPPQTVIRVVYMDPPGRELWLDQQRPEEGAMEPATAGLAATTLLAGDTLVTPVTGGARSLAWIHQSGFRLALTGFLPADSLRALARRVQ